MMSPVPIVKNGIKYKRRARQNFNTCDFKRFYSEL